jgi:HTH-type transcriptional regulator/antitoxin HipB
MVIATSVAELGSAISAARKARKQSQAEVAHSLGIRQGTVSEIERGKDTARIGNVLRLLQAVGLDLHILAKDTSHQAKPTPTDDGVVIDEPFPDASIDIDAIVAPRKRPRS